MSTKNFTISNKIIWLSSLALGLLMAVPKIAERPFHLYETVVNCSVTALFGLFVWYYNIFTLPKFTHRDIAKGLSVSRLIISLITGVGIMFLLALLQQELITHLDFGPSMLMIEVRGVLVNVLFYMFIHFLYQNYLHQKVSIELERTKMDNLAAQYELLKQQVNPHFLFNSLNTLKYMVENSDEHSVDFILKLSDFYRFTLESRKLDLIPVSEELNILEAYIFLQKARFEDGLDVSINIDKAHYSSKMPPFTLQLLIENCIKHNIVSLEKPLQVRIYSENNFIIVENRIQLKRTKEASAGVGLENIKQRYLHLLDKQVIIEPSQTNFIIKLPVTNENRNY
ncbi:MULTISPECIES: sensor histidine kinase [Niastella]|uniref:Histidine kinase n=1 Tax=Niastella soli TaxID=2821487 RepID=A0ABS3YLY1_9BACT|nr:histidine kinase [Niastella soli]MBO9198904.1 histidine kinase [Niastella soli]